MKRLSTAALTALFAAGLGLAAVAAPSHAQPTGNIGHRMVAAMGGSANFGSPPTGSIPILYNDHHVYAKPTALKQGRVLAALVKGGTVLIPLRSMFEQMGGTVSYNGRTKTVTLRKPGTVIKVTVGKKSVSINGQSRPLDVPPMIVNGTILVPIRVISEGLGAYVQWVPSKEVVVVRYMPATPPPPPAPPATPAPAPTPAATMPPTPTPAPPAPTQEHFIVGDFIVSPTVYDEFSPGNKGRSGSYAVRGAFEFSALSLPWMLEGSYNQFAYPHNCAGAGDPQCMVPAIGTGTQTSVPAFTVRSYDFDGRLGLKVADPRLYVGIGYLYRNENTGYPTLKAFGYGVEKLPDLNSQLSLYGSYWYYPNAKATCSTTVCPTGPYTLAYNIAKYQIGATYALTGSPIFVDLGYLGERGTNKSNAPSGFSENGPYLGLGIKF